MKDISVVAGEGVNLYRPFCACQGLSRVDVSLARRRQKDRHAASTPPEPARHQTTGRLYAGSGQAGRMLPFMQCLVAGKVRYEVVNLHGSEACDTGDISQ